jgi:hypothetical protein
LIKNFQLLKLVMEVDIVGMLTRNDNQFIID